MVFRLVSSHARGQQLAGRALCQSRTALPWILGDIVGLPFLAAQFIQMIREDQADAAVIDAELDAQEAAAATASADTPAAADASGAIGTGVVTASEQAGQQPWWESDRRFSDRFRAVDETD